MRFWQEHASSYEKAVFDALYYLISPDRDDDVAVELHSKVGYLVLINCALLRHMFLEISWNDLVGLDIAIGIN